MHSDKRERVTEQTVFTRATLIAEQVTGNFRHFKASGDVDIVLRKRAEILQHRRQYRSGTAAPVLFRLLNNRFNTQAWVLE